MFGYNNPTTYSPQTYYSPQPYQRQTYPPAYPQQPMMQDGAVQGRIVSCKEEAIAAPVNPGVRTLFLDQTHGAVYSKLIDPQTGASDFREYTEPVVTQPDTPQYMTVEMFNEYKDGLERRLEALTKGVTADD